MTTHDQSTHKNRNPHNTDPHISTEKSIELSVSLSVRESVKIQVIELLTQLKSGLIIKERCQAKFLEGHLNELGLLIGPHKSGNCVKEAAGFVWANQEA